MTYLSPGVLYLTTDKKVWEIVWGIRRTQKNRVNAFHHLWLGNVLAFRRFLGGHIDNKVCTAAFQVLSDGTSMEQVYDKGLVLPLGNNDQINFPGGILEKKLLSGKSRHEYIIAIFSA